MIPFSVKTFTSFSSFTNGTGLTWLLTQPEWRQEFATLGAGRAHNFAESATDRIVRIPDPVSNLPAYCKINNKHIE